eukprot:scaffold219515_cov30-Tisochrysis_lutea.AAC.3
MYRHSTATPRRSLPPTLIFLLANHHRRGGTLASQSCTLCRSVGSQSSQFSRGDIHSRKPCSKLLADGIS